MKLCRFTQGASTRIGKVVGETVVDLSANPAVTGSMRALLTDFVKLKPALEAATVPAFALPTSNSRHRSPIRRSFWRSA